MPPERGTLRRSAPLEHFPPKVSVETIVKGVGVASEYLVVGECELHPAHDRVQALGLGARQYFSSMRWASWTISGDLREKGMFILL